MAKIQKPERNIAVVGTGYWGKNLVRNFAELGKLHIICDTDLSAINQLSAQYPDITVTSNYNQVLMDESIKGIVIATPAIQHYPMAKTALLAGKDTFIEKPLALRIEHGRELVELAEKNKRILMVGHLLEYHPGILKLKELIDSGKLGKIEYLYSNRLNLGKLRTEENVLWSFAPHDISVMLLLCDEKPDEVSSHGGYYLHNDIADVTMTNFSFKSGIRAHIFVSWLHPFKEQKLVVVGNKRMAVFNDTEPKNKLQLYDHEIEWIGKKPVPHQKQAYTIEIPDIEPLKMECQDFIDSIKSRNKPRVDGKKGLQVLEVLSYCQKSLEANGRIISLYKTDDNYFIHESSLVEEPVRIGKNSRIWHFSHIMPDVEIGENCNIGQNVFIARGVKIGNNAKIQNNVSVFEGVILEDDVFCGPSCVFTNVINPRSHISRKNEYKPTLVKKGASIGANATIVCGNTIGMYAFIGAGAVVTRDVPDYAMVYGNPARQKDWVCQCGTKLVFENKNTSRCSICSRSYKKQGSKNNERVVPLNK